jgi:hypothetical protein
MLDRQDMQALIRDAVAARTLFEEGLVPDHLEPLLDRLGDSGIVELKDMPAMVRSVMEEGPLLGSYPMLATRFALAEVTLQLYLMKGDLPK